MGPMRLVVVLLVCTAGAGAVEMRGDGGSEVATLNDLGESSDDDPAADFPLPSGMEDPPPAPVIEGDGGHQLDDSVIDESIKVPTFYSGCEFRPPLVKVDTSVTDVAAIGMEVNSISSMKTPEGYVVTIYSERNYEGNSKTFVGGQVHCLKNYNMGSGKTWNDQIASIRVLSAKTRSSTSDKLNMIKEKAAKKKEEHSILREAKNKIRAKEGDAAIAATRVSTKEEHSKGEANAEAKVKAHTKDHMRASESEALAKQEAENSQKSEELNAKTVEKETKQGHEKAGKANIDTKKEKSYKRRAKEKRAKMEEAKSTALDAEEKASKAGGESEQKAAKATATTASQVYKSRESDEQASKVALNNAESTQENSQKGERFAKELLEKSGEKTISLRDKSKHAKQMQGEKFQELQKEKSMLSLAERAEVDAKQTERFSKHSETMNKQHEARKQDVKERDRKIVKDKEAVAKSIRQRVENAVKKAKIANEAADKKERHNKHDDSNNERACKESDRKIAHKKELLDKAQVQERTKKFKKYSDQYAKAAQHTDEAGKVAENASKIVDQQRAARAEKDAEMGQKNIKKKIMVQKRAAAQEALVKGKLTSVTRSLEEAKTDARETAEKSARVSRETGRDNEERQKRSADLEARNKHTSKMDAEATENSEKEEAKRVMVEDHADQVLGKKQRKLERVQKSIAESQDEQDALRVKNEAADKKLRAQKVRARSFKRRAARKEEQSERAVKESEKKEKSATEASNKSNLLEGKLDAAADRKKKQAEDLIKSAAVLETKKEKQEKKAMQSTETRNKVKMKEASINQQVQDSKKIVKETGAKVNEAYRARDAAQEKFDKSGAIGPTAARLQKQIDESKAALESRRESERNAKNSQKDKVGQLVRVKDEATKIKRQVEAGHKTSEKREKEENVLTEKSRAAKEAATKSDTNEASVKDEVNETAEKASLFKQGEAKLKLKLKMLLTSEEKESKTLDDVNSSKKELGRKKEKNVKKIHTSQSDSSELSRKVARAKEQREDAASKKAEAENKVHKQIRLSLKKSVDSLKTVTEKHVKEAKSKMEQKMKKLQANSQWLQNEERNYDKSLKTTLELVTNGETKVQREQDDLLQAKMRLQTAKDKMLAATSKEKKTMLASKYSTLESAVEQRKVAISTLVDDGIEVKMQYEKVQKQEVKAKEAYTTSRDKLELYSESAESIDSVNAAKVKRRDSAKEKEAGAKKAAKAAQEKLEETKHLYGYELWRSSEVVRQINNARKEEKLAVSDQAKFMHRQRMFQESMDEKARKNAQQAVARALETRTEALKAVQETLVKKGTTVANVLMIADERKRKTERRKEETTELKAKTTTAWLTSKKRKQMYDKEFTAAKAALKLRRSVQGQKEAKRIVQRAKGKLKSWTITEHEDRYRKDAAQDSMLHLTDKLKEQTENYDTAKESKTKMDARIKHAQQDCTAANAMAHGGDADSNQRLDRLRKKFANRKIEYAASNERNGKKAKAEGIWDKLKSTTDQLDTEKQRKGVLQEKAPKSDGMPDEKVTIEDEGAVLAKKVEADKSASATSLADEILHGTNGDPLGGFKESGMSLTSSSKADESHPLYRYALERKEKARELTNPDGDEAGQMKKNELLQKSRNGMKHFQALKRAQDENPRDEDGKVIAADGVDTLSKWDARVGTEYRALGIVPNKKPEDPDVLLQMPEAKVMDVDAASEFLVEEMFRNERLYMRAAQSLKHREL